MFKNPYLFFISGFQELLQLLKLHLIRFASLLLPSILFLVLAKGEFAFIYIYIYIIINLCKKKTIHIYIYIMRTPARGGSLRHEFLRRWLKGLQIYSNGRNKKEMSILERKKAIKLSADVAMASTRVGTTCWSRALIAKASKEYSTDSNSNNNKILVEHINNLMKKKTMTEKKKKLAALMPIIRSKKILRKSCNTAHRRYLVKKTGCESNNKNDVGLIDRSSINVAKNLVKKRTQLLKTLVPGGELMDEVSLIRETLDYIVSLRLQVQVMRHLANATVQLEHQQK